MKRSHRRHLKQDELVHGLDSAMTWSQRHGKNILNITLVLVGAGLLLGGLAIYRSRQAQSAHTLFSVALKQYHGVVLSGTGAEPTPGVVTFNSSEERYQASLLAFQDVAENFGGYDAGRLAEYYMSICHIAVGNLDVGLNSLETVREGKRDLLYYLASRSLAAVKIEVGDFVGASEMYRSLVDDTENPLPKDYLLFALGKNEERTGNDVQAQQYYERILAEHPTSQLRGEVTERNEALRVGGLRSPEIVD